MTYIKDVISYLEEFIPPSFQESWDNSGLITGNINDQITGILLSVDFTEEVLQEAIDKKCNLLIAHHPILFDRYIKKGITGSNNYEKLLIKAIKNDLALYAMHTNLDFHNRGINYVICKKLGVKNCKILKPFRNWLKKLVTFVPENHAEKVRKSLFEAGAGFIGNYDSCSYNVLGQGSFRALEGANPFVGNLGKIHFEPEIRIETIFPKHLTNKIIDALLASHPYEEVAYDIYPLDNEYINAGIGIIGYIDPISEHDFLALVKERLNTKVLQYSKPRKKKIAKIAICSGGCGFLLNDAVSKGADAFLTGETNYHSFFDALDKIFLVSAGHFETEKYAIDIFYDLIKEKFNNFVVYKTQKGKNLINYYI